MRVMVKVCHQNVSLSKGSSGWWVMIMSKDHMDRPTCGWDFFISSDGDVQALCMHAFASPYSHGFPQFLQWYRCKILSFSNSGRKQGAWALNETFGLTKLIGLRWLRSHRSQYDSECLNETDFGMVHKNETLQTVLADTVTNVNSSLGVRN